MKSAGLLAAVTGFLVLSAAPARALEPGMFLCPSPVLANDFYNGLVAVQANGVQVDRQIAAGVAAKNHCEFVASARLRPVNFVSQQFLMSDGALSGWASPYLYIIYINRP